MDGQGRGCGVTIVTCGRTNRSERAEQMTRALREQQGFCLDFGCGRTWDLDNDIQHMGVARCLECLRWMCRACLQAHFETSGDAYRLSTPLDATTERGSASVPLGMSTKTGTPSPHPQT